MNKNIAILSLTKELKETQNKSDNFSVGLIDDDIFSWSINIFGLTNSIYEDHFLTGIMKFPETYPNYPPKFTFTTKLFHPNIYIDGCVCLSILHSPGDDKYGYETSSERWNPANTVYSIIHSIINLLNEPNIDSPANVDASILYRDNLDEYKKKVKLLLNSQI